LRRQSHHLFAPQAGIALKQWLHDAAIASTLRDIASRWARAVLVEQNFARAICTLSATGGKSQALLKIAQFRRAQLNGVAHFPLGNGVAKTDIHKCKGQKKRWKVIGSTRKNVATDRIITRKINFVNTNNSHL
jgi:hypothetical protein